MDSIQHLPRKQGKTVDAATLLARILKKPSHPGRILHRQRRGCLGKVSGGCVEVAAKMLVVWIVHGVSGPVAEAGGGRRAMDITQHIEHVLPQPGVITRVVKMIAQPRGGDRAKPTPNRTTLAQFERHGNMRNPFVERRPELAAAAGDLPFAPASKFDTLGPAGNVPSFGPFIHLLAELLV